jgi:hypothetical protein
MHPSSAVLTAGAGLAATEDEPTWLTTIMRPAGSLDGAAVRRLGVTLGHLVAASDMVIVDLSAVGISDPRALTRALREPAAEFERAGRCLLLIGATPALTTELDRARIPVLTLPVDAIPAQRSPRTREPAYPGLLG